MGTNNTLYALEDGTVRFTKEAYVPLPRSAEAWGVIPKLPKGALLYKSFINVVPTKQENNFKLVDMVWETFTTGFRIPRTEKRVNVGSAELVRDVITRDEETAFFTKLFE